MVCAHDSVKIDFDGKLFGLSEGDSDIFDPKLKTNFSDGRFHMDCGLGDCGMKVSTNEDGSELNYQIEIVSNTRPGLLKVTS